MKERQVDASARNQSAQEEYIKRVATSSLDPASQISNVKALLDSGAIKQGHFCDSARAPR
jgi:hypothetical protein